MKQWFLQAHGRSSFDNRSLEVITRCLPTPSAYSLCKTLRILCLVCVEWWPFNSVNRWWSQPCTGVLSWFWIILSLSKVIKHVWTHTATPTTELSSFLQPCPCVWVAAGTWARTMWFIQGLFLSKPPSIYSVLTLVLMRRKGLTYIYHLNCCENLDNLLTNIRTRLSALPDSLFTRTEIGTLVGNVFFAVSDVTEKWNSRLGNRLRGTKRIWVCEVTISTQGLSTQPGESLAAGQPSSGF